MQRYYGQPYARVDNPDESTANIGLGQYEHASDGLRADDRYQPHQDPFDDPFNPEVSSYEPYRHSSTFESQSRLEHFSAPNQPSPPLQPAMMKPENRNPLQKFRGSGWKSWSSRKRLIIIGSIIAAVVIIAVAVGLGVGLSHDDSFSYTPSFAHVTNDTAFWYGGATQNSVNDTNDGIGAGADTYNYYSGTEAQFPNHTAWISFEDMWNNNLQTLQTSCSTLGDGSNNTPEIITDIYNAIQNRAAVSLVDHRYIFAIILQESKGCVHVGSTTSSSGVSNPGLMQSHNGASYSSSHSNESIVAMIQDGTQGTSAGDGLVQNLNIYGNPYAAARGYNSGFIPKSGNLSEAAGATACYVSDVANRLTGWVFANSTCPGDDQ